MGRTGLGHHWRAVVACPPALDGAGLRAGDGGAGRLRVESQVHEIGEAEELIAFGRAAGERGLLSSTCGNVSVRVGDGLLVVSASGSELERLTHEDVALVDMGSGAVLRGPRPSVELGLHLAIYRARQRARAVLHCQSPAATLLACMKDPPPVLDVIPEVPTYVRAHAAVPFYLPGSEELARAVAAAFGDEEVTVVQMRSHGQVALGATWQAVVRRAAFFELACSLTSRGLPLDAIPPDLASELRSRSRDA